MRKSIFKIKKINLLFVFLAVLSFGCGLDEVSPRRTFSTAGKTDVEGRPVKVVSHDGRIFIAGMRGNYPFTLTIDSIGRNIESYEVPSLIPEQFLKVDIFDFVRARGRFFMVGTREPNPGGDEDRMFICASDTGEPENWKKEFPKSGFQAILAMDFLDNSLFAVGFDAGNANDRKSGEAAIYQYSTNCDDISVKEFLKPVRSLTSGDQGQVIVPSFSGDSYFMVGVADLEVPPTDFDFKLARDIFIIEVDKNLDFKREILLFPGNQDHKYDLKSGVKTSDGRLLLLVNEYNDLNDITLSVLEFKNLSGPPKRHQINFTGEGVDGVELLEKPDRSGYFLVGNKVRPGAEVILEGFGVLLNNSFSVLPETLTIYESELENRIISCVPWSSNNDGFVMAGFVNDGGIEEVFVVKTDADGKVVD